MKLRLTAVIGRWPLPPPRALFGDERHRQGDHTVPGMAVGYAGLTCTAYAGTNATNGNLVCVRDNLVGFGVVVSQAQVIVAKAVKARSGSTSSTSTRERSDDSLPYRRRSSPRGRCGRPGRGGGSPGRFAGDRCRTLRPPRASAAAAVSLMSKNPWEDGWQVA